MEKKTYSTPDIKYKDQTDALEFSYINNTVDNETLTQVFGIPDADINTLLRDTVLKKELCVCIIKLIQ